MKSNILDSPMLSSRISAAQNTCESPNVSDRIPDGSSRLPATQKTCASPSVSGRIPDGSLRPAARKTCKSHSVPSRIPDGSCNPEVQKACASQSVSGKIPNESPKPETHEPPMKRHPPQRQTMQTFTGSSDGTPGQSSRSVPETPLRPHQPQTFEGATPDLIESPVLRVNLRDARDESTPPPPPSCRRVVRLAPVPPPRQRSSWAIAGVPSAPPALTTDTFVKPSPLVFSSESDDMCASPLSSQRAVSSDKSERESVLATVARRPEILHQRDRSDDGSISPKVDDDLDFERPVKDVFGDKPSASIKWLEKMRTVSVKMRHVARRVGKHVGSFLPLPDMTLCQKTFSDGSIYHGQFVDRKFSGHGKMSWSNGDVYVGQWRHGFQHGKGTYVYQNNDRYHGNFDQGQRHGYGVFTQSEGVIQEGLWEHDQIAGCALVIHQDGTCQLGEFLRPDQILL